MDQNPIPSDLVYNQMGHIIAQMKAMQELFKDAPQAPSKPDSGELQASRSPSNSLSKTQEPAQKTDSHTKELLAQIEKQIGSRKASFDRTLEHMIEKKREKLATEVKGFQREVFKVVLSGGPCAGKTTAITKLTELLRDRGYTVFVVPEAATLIFGAGGNLNLAVYTDEMKVRFQFFLMMIQMSLEDSLLGIARNTNPDSNVVMLCDRGTMDGRAYIEKPLWEQIMTEHDFNIQKIRDQRYDLVIHITTAANGAEDFYSDKTNAARHESMDFARFIDRRLQEAWIDHPHFVQINNNFASFEEKIDSCINTVYKYLGLETSLNFYNKYLVANPDNRLAELLQAIPDVVVHTFNITDVLFFKDEKKQELTYFRKRVF